MPLLLFKTALLNVKHRLIDLFLSSEKKEIYHAVLMEDNPYYRGLDERRKKNFIVRTHLFRVTTQFASPEGFPVTLPMKIILCGGFVQLTFGLQEDVLDHFNRIMVFSGSYSYKNNTQKFKGDVNPITRTINLSWPAVSHGFEDHKDGINLVLHEFAHSLILENSRRSYFDRIFDEGTLNTWKEQGKALLPKIRTGQASLFREYGGTNLMELFAVSLELFFEKPEAFYREHPVFFITISELLKQDPRYAPDPVLP